MHYPKSKIRTRCLIIWYSDEIAAGASSSRTVETAGGTTEGAVVAEDITEGVQIAEDVGSGEPDPPAC